MYVLIKYLRHGVCDRIVKDQVNHRQLLPVRKMITKLMQKLPPGFGHLSRLLSPLALPLYDHVELLAFLRRGRRIGTPDSFIGVG